MSGQVQTATRAGGEMPGVTPVAPERLPAALLYHAGLYAFSAALLKGAGFILFLWLARVLPVSDYATWGLLYALQTGVASFALVGVVEAVIGLLKVSRNGGDERRLFGAAVAVFVMTAVASVLVASIIGVAALGSSGRTISGIAAVLLSGALLAYSSLQAQIVRLEERHGASLVFNFLVPLAGLVGSFAAFVAVRSVPSFFWGSCAGLTGGLIAARMSNAGFYGEGQSVEWRPIVKRLAPFAAVTFLGWLGGYGNNYIIELFFPAAEVARFTLAFMLAATMQMVATAMNQVWSPRFYRMVHELPADQVEKENRRFFTMQGILIGLAGGFLIALYPVAVELLGGNLASYGGMGVELFTLVAAYVVVIPYWHCQNYFLAFDQGTSMMRLHIVTSLAAVALLALLMWTWGPFGVYAGFLAQMALRSGAAWMVARSRWPVKIGWWGVIAGVAIAFGGLLLSRILSSG